MARSPSLPSSVTERRLLWLSGELVGLARELDDIHAHLTNQREDVRMTATTGQEAGEGERAEDRATIDPFCATLGGAEDYD